MGTGIVAEFSRLSAVPLARRRVAHGDLDPEASHEGILPARATAKPPAHTEHHQPPTLLPRAADPGWVRHRRIAARLDCATFMCRTSIASLWLAVRRCRLDSSGRYALVSRPLSHHQHDPLLVLTVGVA